MDRPDFRLRAYPAVVFADLLRGAGEPLDARALKRRLVETGVDADVVDAAWKRAQPALRRHRHIDFDGEHATYTWSDAVAPPLFSPDGALDRLAAGRLPSMLRAELAEVVRGALKERDELEARMRGAYLGERDTRAAQDRQARAEAVRALAEVAMEVEELAGAGAPAAVTVERIRALAAASGLVPIGRAGDRVGFSPGDHTPVGGHPAAGSPVMIIRPGYAWRPGSDDVLIAKAQVTPVVSATG